MINFNKIAKDYHSKRRKPWKPLEFFLNHLKKLGYLFTGINLDLGCANGRNFKIFGSYPSKLIGIDLSLEFLKIAHESLMDENQYSKTESNFIQLILGNIIYLPIRPNSINNIFSIATIHHVKTKPERKKAFIQFKNSMKKKRYLIITVWRKWQKEYRGYFFIDWLKRNLSRKHKRKKKREGLEEFGDKCIPWTDSHERGTYNRFYHFFSKREIKKLLKIFEIKEFKLMGGPGNRDNFFILAQKKDN
ncbi:MAG: class I SAM-dependent methyltransferase [Promethearchaeota archaeon]